jgi:heat-inducible transcriptional repressor
VDREHLILREVVEGHIDTGEAVGSKAVSARLRHALSSASIRAVMATLVERGLLAQPHTSAGRVPTDRGYREYLDTILGPTPPRPRDRQRVETLRFRDGASPSDLMRAAAAAAASELGVAAVVIAPRLEASVLQRMELVWLGPGRILALAVTDAGLVHERLLAVGHEVTARDLEAFTNFLNALLPGQTLGAVRRVIETAQREDRDLLERQALELGQRALEDEAEQAAELLVEGTSRVLAQREFAEEPARASDLLRSLEQRTVWLDLLDAVQATEDTRVYVGAEVPYPGLSACGFVVTRFLVGKAGGVVAVFGPKRLDYRRAIPLVGLVGRRLGELLSGPGVDRVA